MKRVIETSDRIIKNNIESYYLASDRKLRKEGKEWYKDAQRFVKRTSKEYSLDPFRVAGVVSALSPRNRWERNKEDALAVIRAFTSGASPSTVKVCNTHTNRKKAFDILRKGESITAKSPKTHSFAMNIGLLSADHITIDSWHIRACLTKAKDGKTKTQETITNVQYRRLEALTAQLAKKYKLKGYEFQAIVWLTIKSIWGR